jgi:pimeloyl-ACP methyl ester carboxylesterase
MERTVRTTDGARRLILPGSGHLPHFEVPGEFNAAVLGVLAKLRRSERG